MSFLIAFDAALPAFTAAEVRCGGQKFPAGAPFPWRELGVTEDALHTMWRANFITFQTPPAAPAAAPPKQQQAKR